MTSPSFADAVNAALSDAMAENPQTLFFGLGATDPKRIFGTATELVERFGAKRVFDMPTSENGMTGVAIGAALMGFHPIMVHQRLDFFLLAMDQLVNGAAKWHYMFGGGDAVPLTIRLIMGRGWGQGPTHSQNLQAWFAHVPGLKVVMPATVQDAYGLLLAAIRDPNPVLVLEHRWLHAQQGDFARTAVPLGSAQVLRAGSDVTLVGMSYMSLEALRAAEFLAGHGISAEVVDLRTVSPIDWPTIEASVRKTGRLVALDTADEVCCIAGHVVATCVQRLFSTLKAAPIVVASPHCPVPTSVALTKCFYPGASQIVEAVARTLGQTIPASADRLDIEPHDVPGPWFKGPF
ncbi:MAG: alpha-ketoacid dehydrogenase subunit beta [Planctomycetaceae bacterium]